MICLLMHMFFSVFSYIIICHFHFFLYVAVAIFYFFFFFSLSGAHRDLHVLTHSSPTRRSSDLPRTIAGGSGPGKGEAGLTGQAGRAVLPLCLVGFDEQPVGIVAAERAAESPHIVGFDRVAERAGDDLALLVAGHRRDLGAETDGDRGRAPAAACILYPGAFVRDPDGVAQ